MGGLLRPVNRYSICARPRGVNPVHRHLADDHVRLERLFAELENAVENADSPTIQRVWTDFERGLAAHFDAEERFIFPALRAAHADDVAALEAEHAEIRKLVADLGVRTDLRTLRRDVADELVRKLRAHAEREDATVYPWIGEISEPGLLERLRNAFNHAGGVI